jgi:hypothetical protein
MRTNQKVSITVFLIGLAAFFYFGSEMLANHTNWNEFKTPAGVGEIFGLLSSVTAVIAGALGIDVPSLLTSMRKK